MQWQHSEEGTREAWEISGTKAGLELEKMWNMKATVVRMVMSRRVQFQEQLRYCAEPASSQDPSLEEG